MQELEKCYQYAEECRRMAERAKDKDRAALLEIAEAWEKQANCRTAQAMKLYHRRVAILMLSGAPTRSKIARLVETNSKSL
jgi:hypothetical protein